MANSLRRFLVAVLAVCLSVGISGCGRGASIQITETGSSLLYPLFNLWVAAYTKAHPNVKITTQSTGSGTGMSDVIAGTVQIGASDAYLPTGRTQIAQSILNIPLAISAQRVMVNLPSIGSHHLRLSGPVLAAIYTGQITHWNDPRIAALNPGLTLPALAITPVHRTDGSGDTFLFTQFLAFSAPAWNKHYSFGTQWPGVKGGIGGVGNEGMVADLKKIHGAVGYVGSSWSAKASAAGLKTVALQNRAGNFVLPTTETEQSGAAARAALTPKGERISLVFASGKQSYPIINYEYALVRRTLASRESAKTVRAFLLWAVSPDGGQSEAFLKKVNFLPLPTHVADLSRAQIKEIQ